MSKKYLLPLFALVITLFSFLGVLNNGFVNWDDPFFIHNQLTDKRLSFEYMKYLFTTSTYGGYVPLTTLTYAIEYHLVGLNPLLYHLTNLMLHLANTLLVYIVINGLIKLSDQPKQARIVGFISSLLFGIAPMHVESVAWISERRDVLYVFFLLISSVAYLKYIRLKDFRSSYGYYVGSLSAFGLSALSKQMAFIFPLLLFCYDYLMNRKLLSWKVIIEKVPFFLLTILLAIVLFSSHGSKLEELSTLYPLYERILYASYGYTMYIVKLFIPFNQLSFYAPEKVSGMVPLHFWFFPIPVAVIIFILVLSIIRNNKAPAFGILFFSASLSMNLQLISTHNYIMAERYAYLSSIGLFFVAGVFFSQLLLKFSKRYILWIVFIFYTEFLAIATMQRIPVWKDGISLWSDVIAKAPNTFMAWQNRGIAKTEDGDLRGALSDFNQAIHLNPRDALFYQSRGSAYANIGDMKNAMADFSKAIELGPPSPDLYISRSILRRSMNDYTGALADMLKAREIR